MSWYASDIRRPSWTSPYEKGWRLPYRRRWLLYTKVQANLRYWDVGLHIHWWCISPAKFWVSVELGCIIPRLSFNLWRFPPEAD